jgi:hypothetical protein
MAGITQTSDGGGEWVVLGVEPFGPLDCAVEIFCWGSLVSLLAHQLRPLRQHACKEILQYVLKGESNGNATDAEEPNVRPHIRDRSSRKRSCRRTLHAVPNTMRADSDSITTANNTEPNNSERTDRMDILFPLAPSCFVCPVLRCCFGLRGLRHATCGLDAR